MKNISGFIVLHESTNTAYAIFDPFVGHADFLKKEICEKCFYCQNVC